MLGQALQFSLAPGLHPSFRRGVRPGGSDIHPGWPDTTSYPAAAFGTSYEGACIRNGWCRLRTIYGSGLVRKSKEHLGADGPP